MNLLFICSRNRRRSLTGEVLFGERPGVNALSAGTAPDAETVVSADLVQWADVVFAMEATHKRKLMKRFPRELKDKQLIVLGIPDRYSYMDEALVNLLQIKVEAHLNKS
ncbi:phosphotyrosine protein phosphatase [Terriglobus sp. ADX1]